MSKEITFILTPDKEICTKNQGMTIKDLLGVACQALIIVRDQGQIPVEDIVDMVQKNLEASPPKKV